MTLDSHMVAAVLALALLLAASVSALPAAADGAASVDASVTVDVATVPAERRDRRDLVRAFGKHAGDVMRDLVIAELKERRTFREVAPAGGDYRLATDITRASVDYRELPLGGRTPSTLTVRLEGTCTWFGPDGLELAVPMDLSESVAVFVAPTSLDIEKACAKLTREIGSRAFAALYEARFFDATRQPGDAP